MRAHLLVAAVFTAMILAGCASGKPKETVPQLPEQRLFDRAQQSLHKGRYSAAVAELEALDSRFPFGEYAEQVQIELIYAYYQINNWESTRAAATRFIRLHPNNPQVDYAYYLRGLAAWQAGRFLLESLSLVDISKRDLGASLEAYNDFSLLTQRYPNSIYAPDARQRIIYLRDLLAHQELYIAHFYLRKRDFIAAVERASWVIKHYPQAQSNSAALAAMIEGYMGLKMPDRARETLTILEKNDPHYKQLHQGVFEGEFVKQSLSLAKAN